MIRIFKWWWAWDYEKIENWLETMELSGLRLVETRYNGVLFYFERCNPTKARYCIDYQNKLTPDYLTIINDDGWKLHQIGMGWYILRKEYEAERPNLYSDFEGLIARNKSLLTIITVLFMVEVICISRLIFDAYKYPGNENIAVTSIVCVGIVAFFAFIYTNLILQIVKFKKTS